MVGEKWVSVPLLWVTVILIWQFGAWLYGPDVIPGPWILCRGSQLIADSTLIHYIGISFSRVLAGWVLGGVIAIPVGLLIGKVHIIRLFAEPFLNFIRFIPPIAFITLFLVWFGIGSSQDRANYLCDLFHRCTEYIDGVLSIEEDKIRSARSMGANEWQMLLHVVVLLRPRTFSQAFDWRWELPIWLLSGQR